VERAEDDAWDWAAGVAIEQPERDVVGVVRRLCICWARGHEDDFVVVVVVLWCGGCGCCCCGHFVVVHRNESLILAFGLISVQ
jgi:hypothetical protein